MNIKKRLGFIIIATLIVTRITGMDQPIVVACNFDVISKNVDTTNLMWSAVPLAAHIIPCFSLERIAALKSTLDYMHKLGTEIAAKTPGITNTIKSLFTELEKQKYGTFTEDVMSWLNQKGVNPVPDKEAVTLLKMIKKFGIPTIGMGNQDSLEHEIYTQKMHDEHNIDLHTLYDGIITIPTLEENSAIESNANVPCFQQPSNSRWFVSRDAAPSASFTHTIKVLARNLADEPSIWSVSSKEQLAVFVNALRSIYQAEPKSPEPGRRFSEIMEENRTISPTKV